MAFSKHALHPESEMAIGSQNNLVSNFGGLGFTPVQK